MQTNILEKYNQPVPRYTSYPPANYFTEAFTAVDFRKAVTASNATEPGHLSFYIHLPFCRHLCHYCGCNSFAMQQEEKVKRYIDAVHQEIDRVTALLDPSRQIAQIHYGGGSPTALPVHYLKALNEQLSARFPQIGQPEIAIECHPGYLDEDYWQGLVDAGFNRVSLGVQDFNLKVLKTVNRRPSLLPVSRIVELLRAGQVKINMDFIYGLPYQTAETFGETIREAITLSPDRLVTFSYAHVPWVNKQQLILEKAGLPTGEEKSRMFATATGLLQEAGYKTIGLDHFVKADDELYTALQQGRLHRNFQGYCTRRTTGQVYAFGATGISQLSGSYAQNSKDIDDYIKRIEKGSFATVKGYALSQEEQITREVIEMLMCNYRLDWQEVAAKLGLTVEEVKQATALDEEKLAEFAADGLIHADANRIEMTPEGALFVRNVAASLDKLMIRTTRTFSKPV